MCCLLVVGCRCCICGKMAQNQLVDKIGQWFVVKEFILWASENCGANPEMGPPGVYLERPKGRD